jgi:hypothetical protein
MAAQTTINKTAAAGDDDGSDEGGSGRDDGGDGGDNNSDSDDDGGDDDDDNDERWRRWRQRQQRRGRRQQRRGGTDNNQLKYWKVDGDSVVRINWMIGGNGCEGWVGVFGTFGGSWQDFSDETPQIASQVSTDTKAFYLRILNIHR